VPLSRTHELPRPKSGITGAAAAKGSAPVIARRVDGRGQS
jgi:hypothetical protein